MCLALHFSPLLSTVTTKTPQRCVIQIANYSPHRQNQLGSASWLRHSPECVEIHCIQAQVTGIHLSCQAPWAPCGFTQMLLGVLVLSAQNREHQDPLHTVTEVKAMNERLLNLLHVNQTTGPLAWLLQDIPLWWVLPTNPNPFSCSWQQTAPSSSIFLKAKSYVLLVTCCILSCLCVCHCHKCALLDRVLVSRANVNSQTAPQAAISYPPD